MTRSGSTASATASTTAKKRPRPAARRRRRSPGWVPDQHGAWFMVTIPAITGAVLAPSWTAVPLLLTWWFGYFTFFAASTWIRARLRAKHRAPVLVYGSLTAIAGLTTLAFDWQLIRWIPAFAPLVAIAVWETWRRRPRSLASGISTVIAACLILPVVASAGSGADARVWSIFTVYLAYYAGTVPYVKTLIRERGSRPWFIGSVAYHVAVVVAAIAAAVAGFVSVLAVPVALVLLARATAMPLAGERRGRPWKPKTVGLLDVGMSVLVVIAALAPVVM